MSINKQSKKIEMIQRRFGYFPRVFRENDRLHTVKCVERCWTTASRGKMARHYFDVTCSDDRFILFQDLNTNTWHMENARQN